MENHINKFILPALLGVLIFTSNFLQTNLFDLGESNFFIWFIISGICFCCGWFLIKHYEWKSAIKIIVIVTGGVLIITFFFVTFFGEYFSANQNAAENILLFALRNIMLGGMGIFGLTISIVNSLTEELKIAKEKLAIFETRVIDSRKESMLLLKEAQLKAQKIIQDAEASAASIINKKESIEKELREFIQIEKELIKKYEEQS